MKNIRFNMNQNILVKLNEEAYPIWKESKDKYLDGRDDLKESIEQYKLKADENGYTEFQAWEFMSVFGSYLGMGFDAPFKTEILICVESNTPDGEWKATEMNNDMQFSHIVTDKRNDPEKERPICAVFADNINPNSKDDTKRIVRCANMEKEWVSFAKSVKFAFNTYTEETIGGRMKKKAEELLKQSEE